ncbi:MAG: imidazolonepropionase [Cyclobacteriaceae bacterium]|nr:imidazolonepropionase [Cyclobacteriaceae bacterium]
MDIVVENIKGLIKSDHPTTTWLAGAEMDTLEIQENAFLCIENGLIHSYGPMELRPQVEFEKTIDASGSFVLPSFVDSHTHLVFAGSREQEFEDKINGLTYAEIAQKGGGILNSALQLRKTSEEQLYQQALARVLEVIRTGTGALEIKSGYGLTLQDEIKMLRVARKLNDTTPVTMKTTFLGAHAFPPDKSREAYMKEVTEVMIPKIAAEGLADYCDVFCEEGFFTPQESELILNQGLRYGLKPKVHANQLNRSGGVQTGVKVGALSVDHLECIGTEEIEALQGSTTMPTALPGAAFFLNLPYPPARDLLKADLPLAIASDYNPGSAPSGNMGLILSLACIKMRLTPAEALNAATINGAYAMEVQDLLGSITPGKVANVFITQAIPSLAFLPYSFGSNLVKTTILNGKIV